MRIGSLFSGIGGLELGLEWAGVGRTVWQVEIEPFCRRVLAKHWPHATRYEDVRSAPVTPVDVICGGFPCQDVSSAHSRVTRGGLDGEKSGLWREYARIVRALRPRGVVVENVASGAHRWLCRVRRDLHDLGYRTEALAIDSDDVGAPHGRERIFVVAHADREAQPVGAEHGEVARVSPDAERLRHWREPFTGPVRVADGVPSGLDGHRLKALGNAVVPQCAYVAGLRLRELMANG
jgi:DNA (cytosine-5)-methyltransferase 1